MLCYTVLENRGAGDPNLFEGDMILTPEQRAAAEAGQDVDAPASRGSIRRGLWKGGVLVYEISSSLRKLFIQEFNKTEQFLPLFRNWWFAIFLVLFLGFVNILRFPTYSKILYSHFAKLNHTIS